MIVVSGGKIYEGIKPFRAVTSQVIAITISQNHFLLNITITFFHMLSGALSAPDNWITR